MNTPERQSAPTGAPEPEVKQEADRPLGDAACSASFVDPAFILSAPTPGSPNDPSRWPGREVSLQEAILWSYSSLSELLLGAQCWVVGDAWDRIESFGALLREVSTLWQSLDRPSIDWPAHNPEPVVLPIFVVMGYLESWKQGILAERPSARIPDPGRGPQQSQDGSTSTPPTRDGSGVAVPRLVRLLGPRLTVKYQPIEKVCDRDCPSHSRQQAELRQSGNSQLRRLLLDVLETPDSVRLEAQKCRHNPDVSHLSAVANLWREQGEPDPIEWLHSRRWEVDPEVMYFLGLPFVDSVTFEENKGHDFFLPNILPAERPSTPTDP